MDIRKTQLAITLVLLACAGASRAAEISVASTTVPQGGTTNIIASGSIDGSATGGPDGDADGVMIIVELVPQAGTTGSVTFTPAANPTQEDIVELTNPFAGGTFSGEDTNDTLDVMRNSSQRSSGAVPASTTFSGTLTQFPIIASADATGVWDIKLSITFPAQASRWIPNGGVTTTNLIEGIVTVTIPEFCNNDSDCDDLNACTDDTCSATTSECVYTNDDTNSCNGGDVCQNYACVAGACTGTPIDCSGSDTACSTATCDGTAGSANCTGTPIYPSGTACGDPSNSDCDLADTCDGAGACQPNLAPGGTACGDATNTQCDLPDTCDGSGACQANYVSAGTSCGSAPDVCSDQDTCDGAGVCLPNHQSAGTSCGVQVVATTCDALDTCDGNSVCLPNYAGSGTTCDDSDLCTEDDSCDGAGACAGALIGGCVYCDGGTPCVDPDLTDCVAVACVNNGCQFSADTTNCYSLALQPNATCYVSGNTITVSIQMSGMTGLANEIIAGQFYLEYDPSSLSFVSADPVAPFTQELSEVVDMVAGNIDYSVGAVFGAGGTTADSTMATLTFTAGVAEACGASAPFVRFRTHAPPNAVVDAIGSSILPTTPVNAGLNLVDMGDISIDAAPPGFDSTCPSDITGFADAGQTSAVVAWPAPVATDSCDGAGIVTCTRVAGACAGGANAGLACAADGDCPASTCTGISAPTATGLTGDTFPEGTTAITCTATDSCGNVGTCLFDVSVVTTSELIVDVEIFGAVTNDRNRCITFELFDCAADPTSPIWTQEKTVGFVGGVANDVSVLVPSDTYTCVTARDRLHTLRATAPIMSTRACTGGPVDGAPCYTDADCGVGGVCTLTTQYHAQFLGNPALTGHGLRAANYNDDVWSDIRDFAVMWWQWGPGSVLDTDCSTSPPHVDVTGDGSVDTVDFTHLSLYYTQQHENNCCGAPGAAASSGDDGPIFEMSLPELATMGLGDMSGADLNHDGWLNQDDIAAFFGTDGPGERTPGKKRSRGSGRNRVGTDR